MFEKFESGERVEFHSTNDVNCDGKHGEIAGKDQSGYIFQVIMDEPYIGSDGFSHKVVSMPAPCIKRVA